MPLVISPDEVVVNGMSPFNRGSRWANAGWVVEIRPEDLFDCFCQGMPEGDASLPPVLFVMDFQERLERLCRLNGGMTQTAPAQRMVDFVQKKNYYGDFFPGNLI